MVYALVKRGCKTINNRTLPRGRVLNLSTIPDSGVVGLIEIEIDSLGNTDQVAGSNLRVLSSSDVFSAIREKFTEPEDQE